MGHIAKLLSFFRSVNNNAKVSEAIINPGGGANLTCEHYADAGDDSFPMPNDYVATVKTQRTGVAVAVGYLDPKNSQKSEMGDKRIYARDQDGILIVELWLKNNGNAILSNETASFEVKIDGSIKGVNDSGSFELKSNGDFVVNGVKIDTAGNITAPNASISAAGTMTIKNAIVQTSLLAGGKQLVNHTHPDGSPNTGVNN